MKKLFQNLVYKFYRNQLGIVFGPFMIFKSLDLIFRNKIYLPAIALIIVGVLLVLRAPRSNKWRGFERVNNSK
jgi:hypothetical protein